MTTARHVLFIAAAGLLSVLLAFAVRDTVADAQPAPSLDAGTITTATSDIAPAVAPVAESVPPAPAIDPLADPAATASTLAKLWRSGAIPSAAILLAFALFAALRKYIGWFSKGHQAAVFGSIFAGLAMLVTDQLVAGQTPNLSMVIAALSTAVALYLRGEAKPVAGPVA